MIKIFEPWIKQKSPLQFSLAGPDCHDHRRIVPCEISARKENTLFRDIHHGEQKVAVSETWIHSNSRAT